METCRGLPGNLNDGHSLYIEAAVDGILIGCLYLPNGNPAPGPRFDYKLRWFDRLAKPAAELPANGMPVVLAGSPAWPGRGRAFWDRQPTAGDGRAAHR
jgi:exodeoxyribonuclease-3